MPETYEGLIVKATGGFYYVRSGGSVTECRARGIFRKEGISPLVGDRVKYSPKQDTALGAAGTVEEILPRKNSLIHPPVANLDRLVIVASLIEPQPDLYAVDRLTAVAEHCGIEPVVVFTKTDLGGDDTVRDLYEKAGFHAFTVSSMTGEGVEKVRPLLASGISAFTGNTGVGKTSLLNSIDPGLGLKVGEISRKLGRGRHTTRTVELFELPEGGMIADTPGFSSVDYLKSLIIRKESLQNDFPEFVPYIEFCRFTGCSHTAEKGCAVLQAVRDGLIAPSRHASYCMMYEEVKDLRDWEMKPRENR